MNIFYLDKDPIVAAEMSCDKHVCKMIVESAQMLSTAHRLIDGKEYIDKNGKFPENLTVRLSSWFRESAPSKKFADSVGAVSSTVGYKESAHECPAGSQGNKCLDCRACWDKSIPNVDYPLH